MENKTTEDTQTEQEPAPDAIQSPPANKEPQ